MDRFSVFCGGNIYDIDLRFYKFLIGTGYQKKFDIYGTLKSCFNKIPNSEYASEQNARHGLLFNGKPIDSRKWKYFEVTPFFDMENELKIGSKSLVGKYLDSFSDKIEQNEIFNTLKILVNSFNQEFFEKETTLEISDKEFKLELSEITRSTIFKEVISTITHDFLLCNCADLDYEETILLQLKIIDSIASSNTDKLMCVYCNIPYLTRKIKAQITGMKYKGCFILVDTLRISEVDISDCSVVTDFYVDFANSELLIDKIMDFPFHIEIEELIARCQNAINTGFYDPKDKAIVVIFPWEIYNKLG